MFGRSPKPTGTKLGADGGLEAVVSELDISVIEHTLVTFQVALGW